MKRLMTGLIAFVSLGVLVGCSTKTNSSNKNADTKSSVKENKKGSLTLIKSSYSEPHIWYKLPSSLGSSGKDAVPSEILFVKNGKITEYDTNADSEKYDNYLKNEDQSNEVDKVLEGLPTIGDYSKMNDAKIISTAKKVDKELFELEAKVKTETNAGLGNTYAYSVPVPRQTTIKYDTDKSGNNVSSETVKITKSYRPRNLDVNATSQYMDTGITLNKVTDGYTQIYDKKYYGYISGDGSGTQNFYMTTLGKNDTSTVHFDKN